MMANACKLSSVLIFCFIAFLVVHHSSVSQSMAARTFPHPPEHTTTKIGESVYLSRKLATDRPIYCALFRHSGHKGVGGGRKVHHSVSQSMAVSPHPPEHTTSYWSRKLSYACGSSSSNDGGGVIFP